MSNQTCVGVDSDLAGKADTCAGCPNQGLCSSGATRNDGPDPEVVEITRRLYHIKNIILVLSGKGGVGKSTVSSTLARALAGNADDIDENSLEVGILDLDLCGPSLPRIFSLENEQIHQSADGWSPVFAQENLAVMSAGFLLESLDDAVVWRGPKKNALIKQFLKDVNWPKLDYLIIDTPPGTSDEHLSIVQLLKGQTNLKGAVLVTTPQEMSILDVRKQIDFCKRVNLNIIGVVENMATFKCGSCGSLERLFKPSTGGAKKLCDEFGITLLGSLPVESTLARACDSGVSLFDTDNDCDAAKAFQHIVQQLKQAVNQ